MSANEIGVRGDRHRAPHLHVRGVRPHLRVTDPSTNLLFRLSFHVPVYLTRLSRLSNLLSRLSNPSTDLLSRLSIPSNRLCTYEACVRPHLRGCHVPVHQFCFPSTYSRSRPYMTVVSSSRLASPPFQPSASLVSASPHGRVCVYSYPSVLIDGSRCCPRPPILFPVHVYPSSLIAVYHFSPPSIHFPRSW